MFSDTLGQLLVKRTILYLYAREDQLAWDTFKRDVSRYYLHLRLGAPVATGNFKDPEGAPLLIPGLQKPGAAGAGNYPAWKTHRHLFGWP